ncbi:MAG TPA: acyl carrier protein [Polyangiaceae bacterium]|nr:acyl carrier protein [Polyangiaceae bacterium]
MTREEIFHDLRKRMHDMFEITPDRVTLEADLRNDLGLDSIDAIDMAASLQKMTGEKVDLSKLKSIRTVADVVDLVDQHLHR